MCWIIENEPAPSSTATRRFTSRSSWAPTRLATGESLDTLRAADRGVYEGLLSALVPAEVVGAPAIRAPQGVPRAQAVVKMTEAVTYFQQSGFRYVEIDKRAGLRAAEIARDFRHEGRRRPCTSRSPRSTAVNGFVAGITIS